MSDERKTGVLRGLGDALKVSRPQLNKDLANQKEELEKIRKIAMLATELGVDMTAIGEFATMGEKAIDTLKEQLDKILPTEK